jgi:hypothetical protein
MLFSDACGINRAEADDWFDPISLKAESLSLSAMRSVIPDFV